MTEEEIQALRDELKGANDSIKALEGKNREVILKNKKLSTEYSEEKFNELLERNETLENANLKYESDAKTHKRDFEKLTQTNDGLNATNTKLVIDDGILKEIGNLERLSVREGGNEALIAKLKSANPTIVDGVATFDGKTAKDYITEFSNDKANAFYFEEKENSGTGANGGSGNNGSTTGKLDGTKAEQEAYIAEKFNIKG